MEARSRILEDYLADAAMLGAASFPLMESVRVYRGQYVPSFKDGFIRTGLPTLGLSLASNVLREAAEYRATKGKNVPAGEKPLTYGAKNVFLYGPKVSTKPIGAVIKDWYQD